MSALITLNGAVCAGDLPQRVLRFDNGVAGEVSLADELSGEVFEPLRDPALFATAYQHPEMRTAAWANGADRAPEFLLELMHSQQRQAA